LDCQPTDKLGKLLWGRKDTFALAVLALRGRVPPLPRSSDAFVKVKVQGHQAKGTKYAISKRSGEVEVLPSLYLMAVL